MRKSDFVSPYDEGAREHPLGVEPLLVARIQTRREESGKFVLALLPAEGQGVNIALDEPLLHSLCSLLQTAVKGSEWELELRLPTGLGAAGEPPQRLN